MSRNGSGVYSLPAGNPVVTGTTISSTWANTTLSDISTALTGSVASDGQTAMTGNLQMGNNKVTGLAVASASGDALSFGQAATISALTVTGAFAANGGATLGDASGDALTINSSAVSIPNGLNFDSNTLVIDATNNYVGIGTSSPEALLTINQNNANGIVIRSADTNCSTVDIGVSTTSGYSYVAASRRGTGTFQPLAFFTSSLERMRIDSAGNVGIGVTPSAWVGAGVKAIDVGTRSAFYSGGGGQPIIANNFYFDGTNNIYKTTSAAGYYQISTGVHSWGIAPSGTAGTTATITQAMTLDASGNLGIGTTSPNGKLEVTSGDIWLLDNTTSAGTQSLYFANATNRRAYIRGVYDSSASGSSTALAFATNAAGADGTERMRIDSSGNLLVGKTNADFARFEVASTSEVAGFKFTGTIGTIRFLNASAGTIGSIQWTGTTTSFNTSSDYRLKENIAPMTGALDVVQALNPVTYSWKVDGSRGQGFIAHELQAVVPDCVTGEKDAVETVDDLDAEGKVIGTKEVPRYQGIDTSFLVATLTAAIQEQQAIITDLKSRIEALENK